jgi:hypothetical protein
MSIILILRPATGVYFHAAKPYKGILRSVYMSNYLIFSGKIYRFVGIFSSLGRHLKKFFAVNERGEEVEGLRVELEVSTNL